MLLGRDFAPHTKFPLMDLKRKKPLRYRVLHRLSPPTVALICWFSLLT